MKTTLTVCVLPPEAIPQMERIRDNKLNINNACSGTFTFTKGWGKWAVVDTGQVPQCLFFFSLTRQNRCLLSRANILGFSFPRGKVPFSLPAWGKSTKATAILDYSLVNRLYLFQFSLQIIFPCPVVKWHVLGQPLVCYEWCIVGFLP